MKLIDNVILSLCLSLCHCALNLTEPLPPVSEMSAEDKICAKADDCGFVENDTAMHNCKVWVDVVFAMHPEYPSLFAQNEATALATTCAVASTYLVKFSYYNVVSPDKAYSVADFQDQIDAYLKTRTK